MDCGGASATAQPLHGGVIVKRWLARVTLVALLLAWPATASAQTGHGVGVVTTLTGTVTVARAALPAPQPLQFKDDVFVRDHIATAEKSVVRVLLGGKALVTVRELSSLTIKEETGRSTVDLTAGKIAMGVVRQRMRPGEVIEIRTPNAIAAIRGTVLVVELIPAAGGSSGQPSYTTKVHVLHGLVEVSDPDNPAAPAAQVGTLQSWSRTGSEPFSQAPLSPAAAERVFADLRSPPQITEGPTDFMASLTTREQAKALAVAEFLAPEMAGAGAGGDGGPATPPGGQTNETPGVTDAPIAPLLATAPAGSPAPAPVPGPTGQARFSYNGQAVIAGGSLYSLTAGQTDSPAVPILAALGSSLSVGQSLMDVTSGAAFTSPGNAPLLYLDSSTLTAASVLTVGGGATFSLAGTLFHDQNGGLGLRSDMVRVSGGASMIGSGPSALVDLAGSSASAAGALLSVSGGAVLDLVRASAPLLNLTQHAALSTGRGLVEVSNGAAVKLSQMTALNASALTVAGHGVSLTGGATLTVARDLFRIANGSTLTFTNGALVSLSGGSALNVTGALVNFIGTGNTLSISNTLCANGCTMIGNLPVLVTGGGVLSLSNPILNLPGNTLTIAPGSAVITVTGGAQVKQGQ